MNADEKDINLLLSAYADGELGDEELSHVEAYLAEHPEAKEHLAFYGRLDTALAGAAVPAAPVVTDADWNRVLGAVRARTTGELPVRSDTARRSWSMVGVVRWVSLAAALFMLAVFIMRMDGSSSSGSSAPGVPGGLDAENGKLPIAEKADPDNEVSTDDKPNKKKDIPKEVDPSGKGIIMEGGEQG